MEAVKLFLSLCVLGAMVVACLLRFDIAGLSGLAGGVLGFLGWFLAAGQSSWGERLGNGYVGAFVGLCLGFAVGGVAQVVWQRLGTA